MSDRPDRPPEAPPRPPGLPDPAPPGPDLPPLPVELPPPLPGGPPDAPPPPMVARARNGHAVPQAVCFVAGALPEATDAALTAASTGCVVVQP